MATTPKETAEEKNVKALLDAQPKVRIIIQETMDESAPPEVYVGVNGRGFKIKRGVAVDVPQSVVNVLTEQVKTIWRQQEVDGKPMMISRSVPAYPFSIVPRG